MVGTVGKPIGALELPGVANRTTTDAVGYALTLIAGWNDEKRKPLEKLLKELRKTAENNQQVYDAAAKALNQLSSDADKIRKATMELDAHRDKVAADVGAAKADLQDRQQKIAGKDLRVAERVRRFNAEMEAREDAVETREQDIKRREDESSEAAKARLAQQAMLDRTGAEVARREAVCRSLVANLRAVIDKTDLNV